MLLKERFDYFFLEGFSLNENVIIVNVFPYHFKAAHFLKGITYAYCFVQAVEVKDSKPLLLFPTYFRMMIDLFNRFHTLLFIPLPQHSNRILILGAAPRIVSSSDLFFIALHHAKCFTFRKVKYLRRKVICNEWLKNMFYDSRCAFFEVKEENLVAIDIVSNYLGIVHHDEFRARNYTLPKNVVAGW